MLIFLSFTLCLKRQECRKIKHFDDTDYTGNPAYNWQKEEGEEGSMEIFEPYISTVVEVADTRPKTVWTIVDVSNSDDMHIIAGYHLVDRVFHFITNEEWQDEYEAYMWS